MKLYNNEELDLHARWEGDLLIVSIGDIEYVTFDDQTIYRHLCLKTVVEWVEHTYYDGSYLSNQYVPPTFVVKDLSMFADKDYSITDEGLTLPGETI